MGYFKGLTDSIFKKDAEGNTVFYPYGMLGSGYVIKSKEKAEQVQLYVVIANVIGIGGVIASQALFGLQKTILFLMMYAAGYIFFVYEVTKGLERSGEGLGFTESLRNAAQSYGLITVSILAIASIAFVIMGFMILPSKMILGAACIAFFGLAACMTLYMLFTLLK